MSWKPITENRTFSIRAFDQILKAEQYPVLKESCFYHAATCVVKHNIKTAWF